ncbi:MAG: adenylate/guanylate cyclase domain-containing protein [Pseudomonadota bacterium]
MAERRLYEFLESLSLEKYCQAFEENDVDFETLHHLTDEDLASLGLSLGHRRKLIAVLKSPNSDEGQVTKSPQFVEQTDQQAQRRYLTVMFCDLVGSTKLSATLDPEDLRNLMQRYHHAASQVIVDQGGHVAKLMGDGILAYFGFPNANESDCERAVRAAQSVISAVAQIAPEVSDLADTLEVRIGIATGMVVIGDMTGVSVTDFDSVVGETPNLAARLQTLAKPGTIVISSDTHALVGDVFEYEDLGKQHVAGFPEPLPVWRVLNEKQSSNRFDLLRGSQAAGLVGREEEIELLKRRWNSVKLGTGSVVFISGDAGIGKSRLLQSLRRDIAHNSSTHLQFQCSQFHTGSAFAPVVGHLENAAGFNHEDSQASRASKLRSVLGENHSEILSALMRIQDARTMSAIEPDPELRRERILVDLMKLIESQSADGPMLIVFEDLHWIDASTLEFVNRLADAAARLSILLVLTTRPGVEVTWLNDPHVSFMMLKRLDQKGVKGLIQEVARGRSLPADVLDQIEQRTDGIPLFVEELTRSLLNSDYLIEKKGRLVTSGIVPPQAIPMTLQETLMARLDKLSSIKDIAQLGAIIGRRFSFDLIAAVSSIDESTLSSALKKLELEGILSRRGTGADFVFEFRHALIREAAYESLLKSRRIELHALLARHLMRQKTSDDPDMVAYHLTEAGLGEEAIDFWIAAGDASVETAGFAEALSNYSSALVQLREIPADSERYKKEIDVLLAIGPCQVQVLGPASNETYQTYSTVVELSENYGEPEQQFKALWGLWFHYFMLGAVPKMHELANQLIPLAREVEDEALELEGHHCEWAALSLLGDCNGALSSTEKGIKTYDEEKHHWMTFHYGGHDPGLCAQSLRAVNLCVVGQPDRAKNTADKAIKQALRLNHGYSILETLFCALIVMMLRSEFDRIRSHATQLIELADAKRLPSEIRALANGFIGWSEIEAGSKEEGLALMADSISGWQEFWGAWCFPLDATFALALAQNGNPDAALKIVDSASEIGGNTGGHWWDAEFHRVRGNILLSTNISDEGAIQASFQNAIKAAQDRNALLFEMRAATDLAELNFKNGDQCAAHGLLAPLLDKISEGRDLPDFIRAAKVLDRCVLD